MTHRALIAPLVLILNLFGLAASDQKELSFVDYKSRLQQYEREIEQTAGHPHRAADFCREVPSTLEVSTPSGAMSVSMEFLRRGLANFLKAAPPANSTILQQLSDRLRALRSEADAFEQVGKSDPAMRQRLNEVLSSREFRGVRGPSEWDRLKQRINTWIEKQFSKHFPKAPDLDQAGSVFVWIMIAVASSVLAIWLFRRSRESVIARPREIVRFPPSTKGWETWLAEAREKAAIGHWREAIRLAFWGAVLKLERDGEWHPDATRTPREYLNAISATSGSKSAFETATRTFESAWYGGRPTTAGDFELFMAELEKLGCRG